MSSCSSKFMPSVYCLKMYCINFRQGFSNFALNTLTFKLTSKLFMKQFSNIFFKKKIKINYIMIMKKD